ncbi:MAG: FkbM family methyltransferase [Phycisphaerales bacterium]|nr:FkbM family methyltransferase [Phycisphaerales bacterium]
MARSIHKLLNRLIPIKGTTLLRSAALEVIPSMRHLDMPSRLRELAAHDFAPKVIHDIGAARGDWSLLAHKIFPSARIFAFEPNQREAPALEATKRAIPAFDYKLGFLGPKRDTIRYADEHTQTSILSESAAPRSATAEMYVLDDLVASGEVPAPDFLKLDVQGFELEVLKGAENTLKSGPALLLEVSFFEFLPNMPLFGDVLKFITDRGYVVHDIMGLVRRQSDDALWFMDIFCVPRDHPLRRPTPTTPASPTI